MNVDEHLLVTLIEECNEVSYHTSKALRFGLDDRNPRQLFAATEQRNIETELNHILAMIELLSERGIIPNLLDEPDREAIDAKKKAVWKYCDYAHRRGTIQPRPLTETRNER